MINLIIIKQNSKISNVDKCLPFCSFKLIEFIRLQREKCTKNALPSAQKSSQFLIFMSIFHKTWWYFIFAQKSQKVLQGVPESFELYSKVPNKRINTIINSKSLQWPPITSKDSQWHQNMTFTLFEKSNFCSEIQFWQNPNIFTRF